MLISVLATIMSATLPTYNKKVNAQTSIEQCKENRAFIWPNNLISGRYLNLLKKIKNVYDMQINEIGKIQWHNDLQ